MAAAALRVAGRQLSQHSGAGAPILLRQVRAGGTAEPDHWALGGGRDGTPGSFKSGEIWEPLGSGLVPGSFTEEGAEDPDLKVLESGD